MKQMTAFLLAMIMIATPLNALSGATSDIVQQLAKDSASSGVLSADSSGLQGPSDVPDGVSGGDWNDILALYQEARYHLTWHGPSNGYVASNPDNGWHATFKEGGARVTATGSAWSWSISPTIYGYEGNMIHLNAAPSTVSGKNRISSAFSEDFTAWYINDEKGLEHGFDIAAPPEQGAGPLVINIALETGLEPAVYPGGICFLDGNGEVALDYSELLVTDSTGAELPSELSISSDCRTITISLDDSGAAYPITIDPLLTTPVKKLTASDGAPNDLFGASVAVSGDTIVVGAYGDDGGRGSAYVFTRNNGGADYWGQVEKLTATDGAASDLFGASVAVSGDTILVGAYGDDGSQGSAYVFTRNSGGADYWGQVKKLTAKDGTNNDLFGASVAISGDIIIVGAFGDDVVGSDQGSAYVFTRNNGSAENWGMIKKLTASDGGADDYFGASVSVSGDTVTVGAYGDDSGQGSVYVFTRNNGGADYWGQVKKLNAADGAADDWFGASVSVSGDTIVVGSYGDETGQGSAYVFMRNNGGADYW
ncbi:MAG: FG-GAP repeat protein, partial [Thermoplasmata archaeon]|nr:FG-GAP repeat protein [Thermoplasmata archaeon]